MFPADEQLSCHVKFFTLIEDIFLISSPKTIKFQKMHQKSCIA